MHCNHRQDIIFLSNSYMTVRWESNTHHDLHSLCRHARFTRLAALIYSWELPPPPPFQRTLYNTLVTTVTSNIAELLMFLFMSVDDQIVYWSPRGGILKGIAHNRVPVPIGHNLLILTSERRDGDMIVTTSVTCELGKRLTWTNIDQDASWEPLFIGCLQRVIRFRNRWISNRVMLKVNVPPMPTRHGKICV